MRRVRFRLRIGFALFIFGFGVISFTTATPLAGSEDQKISTTCRISPKLDGGKTPNAGPLDCGGGPGRCLLD